jgi:hypothetical protein
MFARFYKYYVVAIFDTAGNDEVSCVLIDDFGREEFIQYNAFFL